jgi:pimeloyl-ACP methyl ester carboxylesterase
VKESRVPLSFDEFGHGRVDTSSGQMHYRIGGKGDPVVLLHGWPQHSLQWHTVGPLLAERFCVVCPDLPGCGGSAIPRSGYDKRTIAASVRQLVDQLGLGPIHLVGYDHGAGVAYNYAVAEPEAVRKLAVVEYVLPGCGYEEFMKPAPQWNTGSNWQLALFTVPDVAEFAFRGRERELLTWFFWHSACNPAAVSPKHLTEYVDQLAKPGALRAGIEYYAAAWQDLDDNKASMATKLKMPVLGVGGRFNMAENAARRLELVAENVAGVVIDTAGHWVSDENPTDLARALTDFFAEHP